MASVMARVRISELRAKTLLSQALGSKNLVIGFDASLDSFDQLLKLDSNQSYVVKVDEGIKRRMKLGLIALNKKPRELREAVTALQKKGYRRFIIEPFFSHDPTTEKYLALELVREGLHVWYSSFGGIDIEDKKNYIKEAIVASDQDINEFSELVHLDQIFVEKFNIIKEMMKKYHISFIEFNPLVIINGIYTFLDVAAEVDSAAEFFVKHEWSEQDFRSGIQKSKTEEEKEVESLASKSQAAFSLIALNPQGSIFMLLSGGGASIVLADEVYTRGYGNRLANYGEYSGNPNAEETYIYAKNVLQLMLRSHAQNKVLIIAGGVANFTDIRITFKGLIKALNEVKQQMKEQGAKVFVRRGGPYQSEGLEMMRGFLEKEGLLGEVVGPEIVLTDIITHAVKEIEQ